jgi:hypothetical protein
MVSDVIISLLITSVSGIIIGILSVLYKSKCTRIECGCIKIIRDTIGEEKLDEINANHPTHNLV